MISIFACKEDKSFCESNLNLLDASSSSCFQDSIVLLSSSSRSSRVADRLLIALSKSVFEGQGTDIFTGSFVKLIIGILEMNSYASFTEEFTH
jgi:hypothetical protein